MTYVYDNTIDYFPGAIMLVFAGISFLSIITFSIIYMLNRLSMYSSDDNLHIIENEETDDTTSDSLESE